MESRSYGIVNRTMLESVTDKHVEELSVNGFTVVENVLAPDEITLSQTKLGEVYKKQVNESSIEELRAINELNLARLPLAYDDFFITFLQKQGLNEILQKVLGRYYILHLQNGIINMPKEGHHQSSWHRDLPYQDFVISKPLALSALFCLDNFNAETGGTLVIPFTHKQEQMPSEGFVTKYAVQIVANAGDVILFDSMLFHRAGYNSSDQIRRGVNHVFASGIIKQQINIPAALQGKYADDPYLKMVLGYEVQPATSVADFRKGRSKRK